VAVDPQDVAGAHYALLDASFATPAGEKRADALMMKPGVFVFDFDEKNLRGVAAICGARTFDPDRAEPARYQRYDAAADKTLRTYQQELLHRGSPAPLTEATLSDAQRALLTRVRGVRFAEAPRFDVSRAADVVGGVLVLATPGGLTESQAAPRWPLFFLLLGAGLIAALFFNWF